MAWAEEGASGAVETPYLGHTPTALPPRGGAWGRSGRVSRGPLLSRMTQLPGHGSLLIRALPFGRGLWTELWDVT